MSTNNGLSSSTPGGKGNNPVVDFGNEPLDNILEVNSISKGSFGFRLAFLAWKQTFSTKYLTMVQEKRESSSRVRLGAGNNKWGGELKMAADWWRTGLVAIVLFITVILTWRGTLDAYNQIESAEALNAALNATDDIKRSCVLNNENKILNREVMNELKKLKDEEGLICTDDDQGQRILWDGANFIDIDCCHGHVVI